MPCKNFVVSHFKEGGVFAGYSWHCSGECAPGKPCKQQSKTTVEGNHNVVDTWCNCEKKRPAGCHLVLRQTFEKGNPNPLRECVFCEGDCPKTDDDKVQTCDVFVSATASGLPIELPCADINVLREVRFKYECRCYHKQVM